jgi:pilus assembly protein Flp/PilA
MSHVKKWVRRFSEDENGASLIEYTALLAILLVAVIAVIAAVGQWINTKWTALQQALP